MTLILDLKYFVLYYNVKVKLGIIKPKIDIFKYNTFDL